MRARCLSRLLRAAGPYPAEHRARSAVVFSPHYDDETLGCGGTILQKRNVGARVALAFIGDGSGSHGSLIPTDRLAALRSREGEAAAAALGVAAHDVAHLRVPDLQFQRHERSIADRAARLLAELQPAEIFIPHGDEPRLWSADHRVTRRAALAAARRWGGAVDVYEYPVWLWRHWPWTSWTGGRHERLRFAALTLRCGLGLQLGRRFNVAVPLPPDALARKRQALEQHRSQVRRHDDDPRWAVLGDVSRGEFLACFFTGHEWFRHYALPPARRRVTAMPSPTRSHAAAMRVRTVVNAS